MKLITQYWLNHLCQMLPNVEKGIVIIEPSSTANHADAQKVPWPNHSIDTAPLLTAYSLGIGRTTPLFIQNSPEKNQPATTMTVVYPFSFNNKPFAIAVIELVAISQQQDIVKQIIHWAESWLQLLLRQNQAQKRHNLDSADNWQPVIRAVDAGLEYSSLQQASTAIATSIAQSWQCQRVSIGRFYQGNINVQGVSYSADFDARSNLIKTIEAVMQETVEQQQCCALSIPLSSSSTDKPAHQHLLTTENLGSVYSIPLYLHNTITGAMVIEMAKETALNPTVLNHGQSIGKVLAIALALKQPTSPSSINKILNALQPIYTSSFTLAGLRIKPALLCLAIVALLLAFAKGEYRISAPATLEGRIQRSVVAPFKGYVSKATTRAGDIVTMGEVIAELDTQDLALEQRRLQNRSNELEKQYRKALAELNHSEALIVQTQIAQAQAKLQLHQQQMQRAQLLSPLDGIIISGDLSRSLGAPVERGQVLFEVAPLKQYRLVLNIDQREIAAIKAGQQGMLFLSAFPQQQFPFVIEQISTVFDQQGEQIHYRTEASIQTDINNLRPGMQGVGKISVGNRPYRWIVFHRLIDWVRLQVWSWLP